MRLMTLPLCALVMILAFSAGAASSRANAPISPVLAGPDLGGSLQLRQFHVDRVSQSTPEGSARQSLTCWQITHGSWNGQSLDGLSLVLVKQGDGNGTERCLYVSDTATLAQREALVAAVAASNPSLLPDVKSIRIEPASIEVEQLDGTTLVLHLARIA